MSDAAPTTQAIPATNHCEPAAQPCCSATSWLWWGVIARCLVALILVAAAIGKIQEPMKFAEQIQSYRLVPIVVTNAMALIVPWLEVVVSVLLVAGAWRRETRWVAAVMLIVFTLAKVSAEVRGLNISCGCFGGWLAWLEKPFEGWRGIALNVGLLVMLAVDWLAERNTAGGRGAAASAS